MISASPLWIQHDPTGYLSTQWDSLGDRKIDDNRIILSNIELQFANLIRFEAPTIRSIFKEKQAGSQLISLNFSPGDLPSILLELIIDLASGIHICWWKRKPHLLARDMACLNGHSHVGSKLHELPNHAVRSMFHRCVQGQSGTPPLPIQSCTKMTSDAVLQLMHPFLNPLSVSSQIIFEHILAIILCDM